jgi:adenylate kinase family enzyme
VIICGLPGSGKTTLSKLLSADHQALRMCPDDWLDALGFNLWNQNVRARIESLQWTMTQDRTTR